MTSAHPSDPFDELPPAHPSEVPPVNAAPPDSSGSAERARAKLRIRHRRRQVAAMILARVDERAIAEALGVSPLTVRRDRAVLTARWAEAADRDIAVARTVAAAQLDADEVRIRDLAQRMEKAGDLEGCLDAQDRILKIHERRAKLLGLDAPELREVRIPLTWGGEVVRHDPPSLEYAAAVAAVLLGSGALELTARPRLDAGLSQEPPRGDAGRPPPQSLPPTHEVRPHHADPETGRVSMDPGA